MERRNSGNKNSVLNKNQQYIPSLSAFTILEALVVLSLLSVLIAFFFRTINRLSEQAKNEVIIKGELNKWFAFRSNLFEEFDSADSTITAKDAVTLFIGDNRISYMVNNDNLYRRVNTGESQDLKIAMFSIEQLKESTAFRFDWKKEELVMRFSPKSGIKGRINNYFTNRKWQKK